MKSKSLYIIIGMILLVLLGTLVYFLISDSNALQSIAKGGSSLSSLGSGGSSG